MRPRPLLLGLPPALTAGRGRPALAMALVLGLALSPIVGATSVKPGPATTASPAAPRPIEPDPRAPQAPLPEPIGITSRVSERGGGGDAAGPSAEASISADGRFVAFSSLATDLVAGDTNGSLDVFVRDRLSGATIRLPVLGAEAPPPGGRASDPAISPDGGFVAFTYLRPTASSAVLVTVPAQPLVLLWDAASGTTRIASLDRNGRPAFGSSEPAISDGGRYVAYTSVNSNITLGDGNKQSDVFRVDTGTGATTMVSQTPSGTSPRGSSRSPAISADGSIVAFTSNAPNVLIPDPPPATPTPSPTPDPTPTPTSTDGGVDLALTHLGLFAVAGVGPRPGGEPVAGQAAADLVEQVFARNVPAFSTELISATPVGLPGAEPSNSPAISADGVAVAFVSFGTDLAPGDGDLAGDVYVRDRSSGQTTLLTGDLPNAGQVAISGNGRIVVFASATNPAAEGVEVYHRDRFSGETIHISVALGGGDGGANNLGPVVSAQGRVVAWTSTSAMLIADDGNGFGDVFVRDLPPAGTIEPAVLDFGTRALGTFAPPGAATLTSVGWTPLGSIVATIEGGNAGDFQIVADGCTGVVLPRPQSCTVTVRFTPGAVGPRSSTLRVDDDGLGSPHTVRLIGAGSNAELTLDPPQGPPGIVTIAEGKGFPPNTEVVMVWSIGINEHRAPVVTDATGAFRMQVLVFHHDIDGPRDLVVSAADGTSFLPIAVGFFVSIDTQKPPGFDPTGLISQLPRGWFLR
jgi:Tol biopolymer transport system component